MIPTQQTFNFDGHTYTVTRVEGSARYTVVRDNRNVRHINRTELAAAIDNHDLPGTCAKLFEK